MPLNYLFCTGIYLDMCVPAGNKCTFRQFHNPIEFRTVAKL